MLVTFHTVFLLLQVAKLVLSETSAPSALHRLSKRTNPFLDASFERSDIETQQINDAFLDAIELASYVVSSDIDTNGLSLPNILLTLTRPLSAASS